MARVPTITSREELAEEARPHADQIEQSRGQLGVVWGAILQSPEVAGRLAHLGTYLQRESALTDADRQLAMIVAARHWDCELELNGHSRAAERAGASPEAIRAVQEKGSLSGLDEQEAQIIQFAREVVERHGFVSDETFRAVQQRYGDGGVTDVFATVGYMCCVASLINGLGISH